MLSKCFKQMTFMMARLVKKPLQTTEKQDSTSGPQITKLTKLRQKQKFQINEEDKKYEELMKGFNQYRQVIQKQNKQGRGGATKQEFKKKQFQQQAERLQMPQHLRKKFLQLQKVQQDNKDDFVSYDPFQNLKQKIQYKPFKPKSQQQIDYIDKIKQVDPFLNIKIKQDALISHILKESKDKAVNLNHPKQVQQELKQKQKAKREQQQVYNQMIRYQKLQKAIKDSKDKKTKGQNNILSVNKKIEIDQDQIWRKKYAPELIEEALNYKNKQLSYFKQLIQPQQRPERDIRMLTATRKKKIERNDQKFLTEKQYKKLQKGSQQILTVQQEGVTPFKDQQYYRNKAIKQFQSTQNLMEYDKNLIKESKKDLIGGRKTSSVIIDDLYDQDQVKLQRKQLYQNSTFGIYDKKLKNMSQKLSKLGLDHEFEDLALLNKQQLFAQKRLRQQQIAYQQYLLKKQKKKKMDAQIKKIHKQKLRDDLNFDNEVDRTKVKGLNPVQIDQGIANMKQVQKQKQSLIISDQKRKQKIHYMKTFKKMSNFLNAYFYLNVLNPNNDIISLAQIRNIVPNQKNTVLNVFWKFTPRHQDSMKKANFSQKDFQIQKKNIQSRLQRQSGYVSGKMTQVLGLRYGPDIRFHYQQVFQQTQEAYAQMRKHKPQIIQLELQQFRKRGLIHNKKQQQDYRKKLDAVVQFNLYDANNRQQILTKGYRNKVKKQKKQDQKVKKMGQLKQKSKRSQEQLKMQKSINDKQNKQKQKVFSSKQQQEQWLDKNVDPPILKKKKQTSSQKLWDQIESL